MTVGATAEWVALVKQACWVQIERNGERFWLTVERVSEDGVVEGLVEQILKRNPTLRPLDRLTVSPSEVVDALTRDDWVVYERKLESEGPAEALRWYRERCRASMPLYYEHCYACHNALRTMSAWQPS